MSEENFYDSDDSIIDPTFTPENDTSDVVSDSFDLDLVGVNKLLFSEEFFKIIKRRNETTYEREMCGIIAVCQVCQKQVKGSIRVSSNFIFHMRKKHAKKYAEFKAKKNEKRQYAGRKSVFSEDVLNFLCDTCSPISLIESKSFLKLFPGKKMPSRRSITRLLYDSNQKCVHKLSIALEKVKYVCTTTDLWSGGKKSFLGYTCHWLDPNTLKRKSVALACRRFKGTHSFDRVTDMICEVNEQYNLSLSKIVYTITDNGSNFVKAFKEFGVTLKASTRDEIDSDEDSNQSEYSFAESLGPTFHNVEPRLSKHFRCATHTLNLLATTDFTKIVKSSDEYIQKLHKASFERCTQIWHKCHKPKSAEIISAVLSSQLITPCVTRWNSLYDSVKNLLERKHKLGELCYRLGVPSFLGSEIEYLEEYLKVLKPIAEGIDFLQGEQNMFFGYFIPTLVTIKMKLRQLENEKLAFLDSVNIKMQEALLKRFEKYFYLTEEDSLDAVIAAIVIPDVKLRFLKTLMETAKTFTEDDIKTELNKYGLEFAKKCEKTPKATSSSNQASFLDFGDESIVEYIHETPELGNVSRETGAYLSDNETSLDMLTCYPIVKQIFMKYNTALPSSAPVERLFSFAGIINRSRRQKLSDSNFEMLVLRKVNKYEID